MRRSGGRKKERRLLYACMAIKHGRYDIIQVILGYLNVSSLQTFTYGKHVCIGDFPCSCHELVITSIVVLMEEIRCGQKQEMKIYIHTYYCILLGLAGQVVLIALETPCVSFFPSTALQFNSFFK